MSKLFFFITMSSVAPTTTLEKGVSVCLKPTLVITFNLLFFKLRMSMSETDTHLLLQLIYIFQIIISIFPMTLVLDNIHKPMHILHTNLIINQYNH